MGGAIRLAIANTGGDEFLVIDSDSFTVGDYRYVTLVFGICGRKPAILFAEVAEGRHLRTQGSLVKACVFVEKCREFHLFRSIQSIGLLQFQPIELFNSVGVDCSFGLINATK